jgi:hypothetical protein
MKAITKWTIIGVVLVGTIYLYKTYNPSTAGFFPACPFHSLTGLQCPGCGSQRAIHHLLNFEIGKAFGQNALLVLAIPYLITGFVFDNLKNPSLKVLKWRKRLFGVKAIWVVFGVVVAFWVLRNLV